MKKMNQKRMNKGNQYPAYLVIKSYSFLQKKDVLQLVDANSIVILPTILDKHLKGSCQLNQPLLYKNEVQIYAEGKKIEEWFRIDDKGDTYYQYWDQDSLISEYADLHYSNGQLIEKISYKEGLKDGKFTGYYPSGKVEYVKRYEEDKPMGEWKFVKEDGTTKKIEQLPQ